MNQIVDSSEKYALAMINIDNFKNINDSYGYEAGDQSIVELSEILRSLTNYHDLVARFMAEEFCIVLKNVNRYSALDILERLKETVSQNFFQTPTNQTINFTISIGAVIGSEDDLEETISQADMMLYKAKQNGKNQVVLE